MANKLVFEERAQKELQSLSQKDKTAILSAIETLKNESRIVGVKRLKARVNLWRTRVRNYRVVYSIQDDISLSFSLNWSGPAVPNERNLLLIFEEDLVLKQIALNYPSEH